jgi:drug/metabolite transporter (DMT)-like permease
VDLALALLAALLFALGTVLQQREAEREGDEHALRAGFLLRLVRRPVWLAGMAADGAGFGAQAAALGLGRLVVVQPLIATAVVFALPIGALVLGRPVTRRDLAAAAAVAAGLGAFLVLANPSGGRADASTGAWIASFAVAGGLSAPLVVAGRRARDPGHRAALLGTATGILWALSAGLTKAVVDDLDQGVPAILRDWHVYALAVVGWGSLALAQASLAAGRLGPALATQSAVDPLAGVLLGVLAFQESLHRSTGELLAALVALLVTLAGIVVLARGQASSGAGARLDPRPAGSGRG